MGWEVRGIHSGARREPTSEEKQQTDKQTASTRIQNSETREGIHLRPALRQLLQDLLVLLESDLAVPEGRQWRGSERVCMK